MGRRKEAPKEPPLDTTDDCLREITGCASEIIRVQKEHNQWTTANPEGSWPGAAGLIGYFQKRKEKAEARFADLSGTRSR
jgi:hypothetical protein